MKSICVTVPRRSARIMMPKKNAAKTPPSPE